MKAARVDDPIYHTSALAGFLIGAIIGIAIIALAAFAFFSCGFLAGLILGFMATSNSLPGYCNWAKAIGRSITATRQEKSSPVRRMSAPTVARRRARY